MVSDMVDRRVPRWRSILAGLLLITFCLSAPVALVLGWARLSVVDTEVYGRTVGNIADSSVVQNAVGRAVAERVDAMLAGENPTATEAVRSRAVAEVLAQATTQVAARDEFHDTWEATNRAAHRLLVAEMQAGWGQPVTLDLTPLQPAVLAEVEAIGVDVPPDMEIAPEDLQIEVLDAATADTIRRAVRQVDRALTVVLAVAVFSLVFAIGLAGDRLVAVARVGFGLALAMIALIALMLAVHASVVSGADTEGDGIVAGAILDAISQGLRVSAIALALLGLIVAAVFTGLVVLRRSTMRRTPAA
jgi:hypothetical protein